jgi:hypothetical protein
MLSSRKRIKSKLFQHIQGFHGVSNWTFMGLHVRGYSILSMMARVTQMMSGRVGQSLSSDAPHF